MTEQELSDFFIDREFKNVEVNAAGIKVYYRIEAGVCHLLILYSLLPPRVLTRQQQENIGRQVREKFLQAGFVQVRILNLVMAYEPKAASALFGEDEKFWVLDMAGGRIILYEDQEGDFCGLQKPLEELLFRSKPAHMASESTEGELRQYLSPFNLAVIVANILVFLFCEWKGSVQDTEFLLNHGALYVENVINYHEYYRLLTYMFLHGSIDHLLNNMLILLFIGNNLECTAGRLKYLLIYFGSGILAGAVSISYNAGIGREVVCVGASGAIFGAVGALVYIILVNKGKVENLTTRQIILFVILSLYGGFISQGVDNAAHIGGVAAGFLLAVLFYRKPGSKTNQEMEERSS